MARFPPTSKQYNLLPPLGSDTHQMDNNNATGAQYDAERYYEEDSTQVYERAWHRNHLCRFASGVVVGGLLAILFSSLTGFSKFGDRLPPTTQIKQFAPQMPTSTIVFSPKIALFGQPNVTMQHDWETLIPEGNRFVNISNPKVYDLKPGIPTDSGVDRYSVTMFHQLHCLDVLRHRYWRLLDAVSEAWAEEERQREVHNQLHDHHSQHCFAYLTESIFCSADLTIEWAKVEVDGRRKQVEKWGVPHQCKDPEAVRAWMEANHGPDMSRDVHQEK